MIQVKVCVKCGQQFFDASMFGNLTRCDNSACNPPASWSKKITKGEASR